MNRYSQIILTIVSVILINVLLTLINSCPGPVDSRGQSFAGNPNEQLYQRHLANTPDKPPEPETPKLQPDGRPDFFSQPPGNQWESSSIQDGGYVLFRERCVGCHGCRAAQALDKYSGEGWKKPIEKYGDPENNPQAFFTQTMLQFVFYYLAYRTTKGEELDMIRNKYRIITDHSGFKHDAEEKIPPLSKDEFFGPNAKYRNYYNDK